MYEKLPAWYFSESLYVLESCRLLPRHPHSRHARRMHKNKTLFLIIHLSNAIFMTSSYILTSLSIDLWMSYSLPMPRYSFASALRRASWSSQ